MPILQTRESYGDTFPSVVARTEGLRAPIHIDLDVSFYPTQKIFAPGFFAGTTPTPNKYRLLPRTRVTGAATGNSLPVTPYTAAVFRAGDAVTLIDEVTGAAGTAIGTVLSVDHAANTITFTAAPNAAATTGTAIGVATSLPFITTTVGGQQIITRLGLITPNTALDIGLNRPNSQVSCFSEGTYYVNRLPFISKYLENLFSGMILIAG